MEELWSLLPELCHLQLRYQINFGGRIAPSKRAMPCPRKGLRRAKEKSKKLVKQMEERWLLIKRYLHHLPRSRKSQVEDCEEPQLLEINLGKGGQ